MPPSGGYVDGPGNGINESSIGSDIKHDQYHTGAIIQSEIHS